VGSSACVSLDSAQQQAWDFEQSLIRRLQQADPSAYELLILHYQEPVYNLVYRLLDDPTDTADVVQEIFLKIFRHIHNFRGNSSLKTWIYRIAVNEAYNHRRWWRRHQRQAVPLNRSEDDQETCASEAIVGASGSPFDITLQGEHRVLIEQALSKLKPVYRQAVVLRDIEDLSYEEIAEILGVSIGTVKSRILRGREALRRMLSEALEANPAMALTPQLAE